MNAFASFDKAQVEIFDYATLTVRIESNLEEDFKFDKVHVIFNEKTLNKTLFNNEDDGSHITLNKNSPLSYEIIVFINSSI
jgi:hypothetical protein